MADKQPWMKFFPNDWLSDEALKDCSYAAKGLWIDLLCLMHKCGRRGYLQQANGQPLDASQIARKTGGEPAEVAHLLQELLGSGVLSESETKVFFSRRMVREAHLREVREKAGQKGGMKTAVLLKQTVNQKVQQTGQQTLASDSSVSSDGERGETASLAAPPPIDFELSDAGLATRFVFRQTRTTQHGGAKADNAVDATPVFGDLAKVYPRPFLRERIDDPTRLTGQRLWQFEKMLETEHPPPKQAQKFEKSKELAKEFAEREADRKMREQNAAQPRKTLKQLAEEREAAKEQHGN